MRSFVSLPNKMVLLLIVMLLALSIAMSILWLNKTNEDFQLKQTEMRQQNQKQYALLNQLFRNRLESWVELFVQIHQEETDFLEAMGNTLSMRFEFLELNWNVDGVWLINQNRNLIYGSKRLIPDYINALSEQVFEQQRSLVVTHCEKECTQVLTIPILDKNGELATLSLSYGLIETLAFLNQSKDASLALVNINDKEKNNQKDSYLIRGPLIKKQREFMEQIIELLPADLTSTQFLNNGVRVNLNNRNYFLILIPMSTITSDQDFVLASHDITPLMQTHQSYQKSFLFTALAMFLISILCFYVLTNSIRLRLIRLARRLPLLSQRNYKLFRARNVDSPHLFRDELDTLNDSADELALRLEQLDHEVLTKTSELENIAMFDQLTQLPNRNMLTFQLVEAIKGLRKTSGYVVVLFFDLDDFKKVNDSYGHEVGDKLLSEAATRFLSVVRDTDVACRLGGDEFAIMLRHVNEVEDAVVVADKLLERFRQPISVDELRFFVSTSIGLAYTNSAKADVQELLRYADVAMYYAKSNGGNCYQIYTKKMSQQALDKVALEDEARSALVSNHFSFALQPQIELATGKLVGFEALLRWVHPKRGFVSPGHFIPILESSEFMLSLGYWCIEHAYNVLKEFKRRGYTNLKVAINLAGIQFLDPELIPYLDDKLASSGLAPELLELELTERTLVSDVERTTEIMQSLVERGFLISIDDFGTGYSSLSYLKKMPAHYIKIDRAFIDGMLSSNADMQIVTSTVAMVQNLGMKVIAEGIEEQSQIDILKALNCDMAQGFHIAKPIPESQLYEQLEKHYKNGVWDYTSFK